MKVMVSVSSMKASGLVYCKLISLFIVYSPLPGDTYHLLKCIGMMFLDGVLHWLIAIYIENAFPGKYGMPKPFYFPFTK